MAAGRRKKHGEHENEERWLLTYADMITLLMALFMVLFSISSVNVSKYKSLQESLKAAFSGSILPGGKALTQSGAQAEQAKAAQDTAIPSIVAINPTVTNQNTLQLQLQHQLVTKHERRECQRAGEDADRGREDRTAAAPAAQGAARPVPQGARPPEPGADDDLPPRPRRAGAHRQGPVRLRPGDAEAAGLPLLGEVANLLNVATDHQIVVEGHTDSVPISSAQYPSNWELSTARATTVVRYFISRSVDASRLTASGYADLHPLASNATDRGRQLNRRVEIVLLRNTPQIPG